MPKEEVDLFQDLLGASQISQIARLIGATDDQTRNAVAAALPTLLGGMGRAAESDEGAARITAQMQGVKGNGFDDIFSNLPNPRPSSLDSSLGPGNELDRNQIPNIRIPSSRGEGSGSSGGSGGGMLDDLFGGKSKRVEDAIGKSSGLDLSKIGPLLAILAPIVLSALRSRAVSAGTRSTGGQIHADDVRDVLRGERRRVEASPGGGMLGALLDQDGDGDFDFSDILKLGMRFLTGARR